jgi:tetratricopeptide (TPR) repeat protein
MVVSIVVPLFMLMLVIPSIQLSILQFVESLTLYFEIRSRLFKIVLSFISIAGLLVLFWIGRERTFFLGDGYLKLRNLPNIAIVEGIPLGFKNEPLTGVFSWNLYKLLAGWNITPSDELAYRFVSIAFGLGSVFLMFRIAKVITSELAEQTLVFLFMFSSGGSQLFFGYVENYTPLYFGVLLFLLLALKFFHGEIHPAVPASVFGMLFTLNFGMICMVPAFFWLLYVSFRRRGILAVVQSIVATLIAIVVCLWLSGYTIQTFQEVFLKSGQHFVPLLGLTHGNQAYTLFQPIHLLEIANLQLLLSPFALVMLAVIIVVMRKKIFFKNAEWVFLSIAAVCGLDFTFVANCDIGMSRDWDLLASFNLGVIVAAVFAWTHFIEDRNIRRRLLVLISLITLLHTISWVAVNADEKRSIARFHQLQDQRVLGKQALAYAHEELAIFSRSRQDFRSVLEEFKKYLEINPTNSRIWGNCGIMYDTMGYAEQALSCYRKAVDYGVDNPDLYTNLANRYGLLERYDDAFEVMKKAIERYPSSVSVNIFMGVSLSVGKKEYREALPFFLSAIELDSTSSKAYLNAGICFSELHESAQMKHYWKKYLELEPNGEYTDEIRQILQMKK